MPTIHEPLSTIILLPPDDIRLAKGRIDKYDLPMALKATCLTVAKGQKLEPHYITDTVKRLIAVGCTTPIGEDYKLLELKRVTMYEIPSLDRPEWTPEKFRFAVDLMGLENDVDLEMRFDKTTGNLVAERLIPF